MTSAGVSIKRQMDDVNKQILQLEPSVKMKNPHYRPPMPGQGTPLKNANGQIKVGEKVYSLKLTCNSTMIKGDSLVRKITLNLVSSSFLLFTEYSF